MRPMTAALPKMVCPDAAAIPYMPDSRSRYRQAGLSRRLRAGPVWIRSMEIVGLGEHDDR